MCGVRITRSRPRSGLSNSSSLDLGSTGNTSMAAPIRCSSLIASARWSSSTTVPRAALIRMPPFFMARISFSPIIHWVDGSSGTCSETMSHRPSSSCSVADLLRVAHRQLGHHVVEVHLHAHRLGQHRQLGADRAVADDAELLAADLEGVGRRLDPAAAVAGGVLFRDAAQQQDGLGQHQLGHRAGVGIGGVEHGDAALAGGVQVDLVGADAEAADGDQLLGAVEHLGGQLGTRADANEVGVGDLGLQLVVGQRALEVLDVGVAGGLQGVARRSDAHLREEGT